MLQKSLRSAGILLIALPEPFTTPVGAALLLASYLSTKKQRADSYENLHSLFQNYLTYYKPFGYAQSTQPIPQNRVTHPISGRNLHTECKPVPSTKKQKVDSYESLHSLFQNYLAYYKPFGYEKLT